MARTESSETVRERVTTHNMITIVGVLWTLVVLMVALALTTRGKKSQSDGGQYFLLGGYSFSTARSLHTIGAR